MTENQPARPLRETALLGLRLGITAFGGPAAHIAMLRNEVVSQRKWLTDADFLDFLGITNLIPGPNSTEMVMHAGATRAGRKGLVLAGVGFILPAATITLFFAWLYGRYGATPGGERFMLAIKPVVIAVVVQAIVGLMRVVPRTIASFLIIALAAGLFLAGVNELLVLFGGGIAILAARRARQTWSLSLAPLIVPFLLQSSSPSNPTTRDLFFSFLKIGSVLYGSGYVLLAFLQGEFVDRHGWLTEQQLLDAVAVGQVTPGPVFSTATFAGYLMGSWSGAAAATIGIFLPAFIFVFLTHGLVHWSRKNETTSALLDGLNLAALGLMAGAAWILGRDAIVSVWTLAIAIVALIALVRFRVNSTWLVLGAAIVGLINAATGFI